MAVTKYKKVVIGKLIYRSEEDIPYYLCYCDGSEDTLSDSEIRSHDNVQVSRKRVVEGFNDLATLHPELVKEWHPDKNGDLLPEMITPNYYKKVWWLGSCGHEWEALVTNRVRHNAGCPYCCNPPRKILPGFNDLASKAPEIAAEWHPTKNGNLKPLDVSLGSTKRVWWKCKNGHEWEAVIYSRAICGCPKCGGWSVDKGKTDLLTLFPNVASEWDFDKNEGVTPDQVAAHSNKEFWWRCKKGHSWLQPVNYRTKKKKEGSPCPYCSNRSKWIGFNDLMSQYPEIAAEWHPTKNGDLQPSDVKSNSSKKVWWRCTCGFEWKAVIYNRVLGSKCPCCKGSFKEDQTLEKVYPKLAQEWHPTKNGVLRPNNTKYNSCKKVWWLGKCGHEWEATVNSRGVRGTSCPYCSNRRVLPGFNDLETKFPELAKEWHPFRNHSLVPSDVTPHSSKKAWWLGPCGHEWEATIYSRTVGKGCPICRYMKGQSTRRAKKLQMMGGLDLESRKQPATA